MILPFTNKSNFRGNQFYPINQILFWSLLVIVILLTWIGARPVEDPYVLVGQVLTVLYFLYYIINPLIFKIWDKILN
jgi:ubiquinol-cytochrome c reductase cytochrome b subunit